VRILMMSALLSLPLFALAMPPECRDRDAIAAGDGLAQSYFKESEIFRRGRVLKLHHPSRHKEVVSYVRTGEKHYSIFSVINHDCIARFIKRTRQGD